MTKALRKILIANRGEIVVRVARTCRAMGIQTVAVFSDVDADSPHVRACDQAVRIGPAPSAQSYLDIDRIVDACRATGAEAIHPGFGFLSENAEFAERCEREGIVFIGPSADAMRAMGSKQQAKRLARDHGVPTVPGYSGDDQDDATLIREAEEIGFPCLVKASAGGGGKGMRVVERSEDLGDAIVSARREASSSFGDDTLLIERYVTRPRHIEIQVIADSHGHAVHLFERECSVQRRHQKIIEEAPSPALDPSLRAQMGEAALRLVHAIGYENAGTVEFILDADGSFYFLEVNARLQVEHPVTEAITGVDLVREQIRVAAGHELSFTQESLSHQGAAIECRLYAEDPANEFLPSSGPVVRWQTPDVDGLRVESGIESGSQIGIHYDPMLAKLITHGQTREEARLRMVATLERLVAHGLTTNQRFLREILETDAFRTGAIHTHLIDELYPNGWSPTLDPAVRHRAALAATLFGQQQRVRARSLLPALPSGFRINRFRPQYAEFDAGGDIVRIDYIDRGNGFFDICDGDERHRVRVADWTDSSIDLEDERMLQQRYEISVRERRFWVQSLDGIASFTELERFPLPGAEVPEGGSVAPMTGTVVDVRVSEGNDVAKGDVLLVVEAMKMEHNITADADGVVRDLRVKQGDIVNEGDVLAVVANDGDEEE